MRVVLTGATGTIGCAVAEELRSRGHRVVALSRDARRARARLGRDELSRALGRALRRREVLARR
jgi:uncharacterized protein YbjT (DUF2867 family)